MNLKTLVAKLKSDWQDIEANFEVGEEIYHEIATANSGVIDPATWVTNAAKAMVDNESKLPLSWRNSKLEGAIINFCTKLETGILPAEIEVIVKEVLLAGTVKV